MKFIDLPNLPKKAVCLFIADADIEGAVVITPPAVSELAPSLSRHTDLGICVVSKNTAVCAPECFEYYEKTLSPYGFNVICGEKHLLCNYPYDCAYNVGIVGKKCFLNKSVCDSVLYDILKREDFDIIDVKQGYTKCSICPIDENSFITGDKGIYKKAVKIGMDVLLIRNDGVFLKDYPNGFFGGCCGMKNENELLINGDIDTLLSGQDIKDFLKRKNIKIRALKKGRVTDIGSVIPLMTIT